MDCNELFRAAFQDDSDAIFDAVKAGADPNIIHPRGGHTPLQVASQRHSVKSIRALLESGADPDLRFNWVSQVDGRTYAGRTALMYASNAEVVRLLVGAGADVNAVDERGWYPLALALEMMRPDVFDELIKFGADVSLTTGKKGGKVGLVDLMKAKKDYILSLSKARSPEVVDKSLRELDLIDGILQARLTACAPEANQDPS